MESMIQNENPDDSVKVTDFDNVNSFIYCRKTNMMTSKEPMMISEEHMKNWERSATT